MQLDGWIDGWKEADKEGGDMHGADETCLDKKPLCGHALGRGIGGKSHWRATGAETRADRPTVSAPFVT